MSILEVFFWFCKEQKIMDVIFKKYHEETPFFWEYSENNGVNQKYLSLENAIEEYCISSKIDTIFWRLFSNTTDDNERYKKARAKWTKFSKNNILFSDQFVKVGDTIEFDLCFPRRIPLHGVVSEIPKTFNGSVLVRLDNGEEKAVGLLSRSDLKINGEERTPEFYIKRRRKLYGANKR
jgi:hypothetical protein